MNSPRGSEKKHPGSLLFSGLLFIYICGFTACAGMKAQYRTEDWLGLFPSESSVYLGINHSTPYLESLLTSAGFSITPAIAGVLEKTAKIFAAMQQRDSGAWEYRIILRGSYSYFLIHLALDLDPDWTAAGDPVLYYSHSSGLKLANPNWTTILLTNGDIEALRRDYFSRVPGFFRFPPVMGGNAEDSDLFCFFPAFSEKVLPPQIPLNTRKLPISETWFTLNDREGGLGGGFNLHAEEQAEKFLKGFKSFLLWWLKAGGISTAAMSGKIKTIEWLLQGGYVIFRNLELSPAEWDGCLSALF